MQVEVYYTTFDPDSAGFETARDIRTFAEPDLIDTEAFATAYDHVLTATVDLPDSHSREAACQRIYERLQGGHVDEVLGYDGSETRSMMIGDLIVLDGQVSMVGELFSFERLDGIDAEVAR